MAERLYPIGIQTFEDIVQGNYVYVDKTKYVYDLTHQYRYVFLSRPRRFGKSLLVSTLRAYFEGKKNLFKGLAIDGLETEWEKYPVFCFDMSKAKRDTVEQTQDVLHCMVCEYEELYGKCPFSNDITTRLEWLFKKAHEQTGKQVVLLIDEYDAPILRVMHNAQNLEQVRSLLRTFYSPIKGSSEHIKFGFITGITKFSQLSIFSEINNLERISMLDEWSGLCGVTETELLSSLDGEIESLANALKQSKEETFAQLKRRYDGYHFSKKSEDVYNPFSLFSALKHKDIRNYWFETATPSWLIEQLRRLDFGVEDLDESKATQADFDAPTEGMDSALPLLFQSGYMTIKEYEPEGDTFILGMPNTEVRVGLLSSLIPHYVNVSNRQSNVFISDFGVAIRKDKLSDALHLMRSYIASLPYDFMCKGEKSYQFIFFVVSGMLCKDVISEVKNSAGRSDMLIKTDTHIYLFEFKYNGSLDKALHQIEEKGYAIPYECDGRKVVKVAVNFNETIRTIDGWQIERDGTLEEWHQS